MNKPPPIIRAHVEKALHQLHLDNPKRAEKWLVKALNLIEVLPERDCSYSFKIKRK